MSLLILTIFLTLLRLNNNFLLIFIIIFLLLKFIFYINNLNFLFINNIFILDIIRFLIILLSLWIILIIFLSSKFSKIKKFIFILLLTNLILAFSSINFIYFYIFFEITLIPITLIIFLWGGQIERLQAGIYIFIYTIFGSLPLLLIIFILKTNFSLTFFFLNFINLKFNSFFLIFFIIAFLIKLPIYGFHLWLPKAHVEAPVAGSIILAGVILKLGGYGIYRIFFIVNWNNLIYLDALLISLRLIRAIIIRMICIRQIDLKILIAYSSICHIRLIIGGIIRGNYWGESGFILLILSHGLCSRCLFCIGNIYYERFYSRNILLLKGIIQIFPSLSIFWFISCVFNIRAPPSLNLLREILSLGGILKFRLILFPIIILVSFIRGFYSIILFIFSQHGKFIFLKRVFNLKINEYTLRFLHIFPLWLYILNRNIIFPYLNSLKKNSKLWFYRY